MNYGDAMEIIKDKKYMRIQGEELAYKTKKPVGVFVLTWRRVRWFANTANLSNNCYLRKI